MKQLIESCKKAIENRRCSGCTALEDENFVGNRNCKFSKIQTAQESIEQVKLNLRNGDKMSKYNNRKTIVDGIEFDSKAEANRYTELKLLQKAKKIKNLSLQPRFLLQESFKKNNKTYRKIEYIADFKYEESGQVIVEDVKGKETEVFKLKHKLFEKKYKELKLKLVK